MGENVRTERCVVTNKSAVHEIQNPRVLPPGVVVTHKVMIINGLFFDLIYTAPKGGLNADTGVDSVPPSFCAEALPNFLSELVRLGAQKPTLCLLVATTDVNEAYRIVRVDAEKSHNFRLRVRLTLGLFLVGRVRLVIWSIVASAAEHSHCNTGLSNAWLLPDGKKVMEAVRIVERFEAKTSTRQYRQMLKCVLVKKEIRSLLSSR